MANNKRQHYVPKSTLRYFSLDFEATEKPKQIRLFNIERGKLIPSASLKEQCYRDYFYGKNLDIEKALSLLEGFFADLIRKMMASRSIDERDGWYLVQMIALQRARTLRAEEQQNAMIDRMMKLLMYNRVDEAVLRNNNVESKEAAKMNIAIAFQTSPLLLDLKRFLIFNETSTPFVIADNPVVSTNYFCRKNAPERMGGLTRAGLQLFMPLSPKFALLLHDSNVYFTESTNNVINLRRKDEIDALNELQWLNAHKNVYLPPTFSDDDINVLIASERSTAPLAELSRAEETADGSSFLLTDKDEFAPPSEGVKSELVIMSAPSLPKDIRLRAVRIRNKPNYCDDGSLASFQRDPIWTKIVEEYVRRMQQQGAALSDFMDFVENHPLEPKIGRWLKRSIRRIARQKSLGNV